MVEQIKKYIKSLAKDAIPQLSVNCVIFGFNEKTLKVIVNKIKIDDSTVTVLPGGYVMQDEDLILAVERIVRESTGLEKILFKQFAVFGDASRSFGDVFTKAKSSIGKDKALLEWMSKRFISICYLALVDFNKITLTRSQFLETAQWLPVEKAKTLSLDHADIVRSARESLLKELPYAPIASNLLPAKFTLPQLHALVEAILGREIDRPNFRRKILKSEMIIKVGVDNSGQRRPADLYSFKHGKNTSLIDEYKLGF
jgi:8-oxo-dGTP diphosphatase